MSYETYLFMMDLIIFVIAIAWTLMITSSIMSSYKLHLRYDWFKLKGMKYAFICNILTHISLGSSIWYVALSSNTHGYIFLRFLGLGVLFFILSYLFGIIGDKELILKFKRKEENGCNSNS